MELKPRDIIGNAVMIAHASNAPVVTVSEIDRGVAYCYDSRGVMSKHSLSYIIGIPLTSEILTENLGFEVSWIASHKDTHFNLMIDGSEFYYSADMRHHTSNKILYVHQVQNLYYSLTSEELEFKIK